VKFPARILLRMAGLALFSLSLAVLAPAQNVLTAAQWRQDLKFLAERVPKAHRNAFHSISSDAFDAAVSDVDRSIPSMSDHEVVVAFARLVAMLGDGHSRLLLPGLTDPMSDVPSFVSPKDPQLAFHLLPVKLYAFTDGIFVVATTFDFKQLLGAQVVRIGSLPIGEALTAVHSVVNRDNTMGLTLLAPYFVTVPEVLSALRIVPDQSRFPITFLTSDGKTLPLELPPIAPQGVDSWVSAFDGERTPKPIRLRHPGKNLWFEYLPDSRTVFVRINVIEDSKDESVADFAHTLQAFIANQAVDRMVLDVRDCHGGNNQLFRSLLLAIIREDKINQPGKLFVIIGRDTFSAAVNAASDLERLCNCIFVGEPTVGSPNSYGDARETVLPNSGLIVRLSTVYWRDWTGDESRPWIAPDITTQSSSRDYFAAKDPSLEAILHFPKESSFADVLLSVVQAGGGAESIQRLYYRYKTDPRYAIQSSQEAMERLGVYCVSHNQYTEALLSFRLNARDYPDSIPVSFRIVEDARHKEPRDSGLADLAKKLEALALKDKR